MLKSTAIDQAERELDHSGGGSPAGGPPRGRHAKNVPPRRVRTAYIRRRWPLVAVAAVALAALFAPPPSSGVSPASKQQTTPDPAAQARRALRLLSTGAPMHAVVLTDSPVHAAGPQVQTTSTTVVTGLAANGIPNVALNAYRVAAARMDNESTCGIDWSLLAGIGRVESDHGRYGGATLAADGTSTPKIIGPALDGKGFAFIRDTDHGLWDGDTVTDRAVGPMQFIPATWRSYAIDANGDGASPFDINDAALAAAHYLCVAGGNLTTDAGQRAAVMAYNHSDSYVNEVLALAHAYSAGIPVTDIPMVGTTSGAIPAPGPTYAYAPASPGPAIGASDNTPATPGQTVGNQPSATAQPAAQPDSGGGAPPADSGQGSTGGSTPVAGGGGGGTGTTGGPTSGTSSSGTGGTGSTSGGITLGPVTVSPPTVTSPLPSSGGTSGGTTSTTTGSTGGSGGSTTPPSTTTTTQWIAGVTCNLIGVVGAPAPIAGLPTCPAGTPLP